MVDDSKLKIELSIYLGECKECGGSQICEHNKRKLYCKICDGKYLCQNEWCETCKNTKYEGYCMHCFINNPENIDKPAMRNYKRKRCCWPNHPNIYQFYLGCW